MATLTIRPNPYLDEESFEDLLAELTNGRPLPGDDVTVDCTALKFIDPFGMVGLLKLGRLLSGQGIGCTLKVPASEEVLSYLERMDFFAHASSYLRIRRQEALFPTLPDRSQPSDVLLEITPVKRTHDVHHVVDTVRERAKVILERHLRYSREAVDAFCVSLAEVCQNIVEHSEDSGLVGIQKYFFARRLGRNAVKIAVMDLGVGVRSSLEEKLSPQFGHAWCDLLALERALFHGASRYDDVGRGHGLAAVRRFVVRWKGKLVLRSGTARLCLVPTWARGKSKAQGLPLLPGTQIAMVLPEVMP
jgi:hypothetical protein